MALAELREGLAFLRILHSSSKEERSFITNSGQPQYHEDIRLDRLTILPVYQEAIHPVLEKHVAKTDTPVIEVGCGSGSFTQDLSPNWLRDRLISFDLNQYSLEVFAGSDSGAQIFRGSSYRIPIRSQAVSTVIGCSSFDSMLYLSIALEETKRILQPGGKLILFQDLTTDLYESPRDDSRQSVEDYHEILVEQAEKAGFSILEGREDYLEGSSVEAIRGIRERVPDFDLEERPFPLVAVWDRGYLSHPNRAGNKERKRVSRDETMVDLTQGCKRMQEEGLLDEFNAKAGDLISFLRMKYLVLQKPK